METLQNIEEKIDICGKADEFLIKLSISNYQIIKFLINSLSKQMIHTKKPTQERVSIELNVVYSDTNRNSTSMNKSNLMLKLKF